MNELKSKFVNIVVAIEEGRGFENVKGKLFILARFSGRLMESDPVGPSPNPIFNTELVWETEKRDLKKARGDYGSIRVDCFTINDAGDKKEGLGYTMLLLRTAHIIPSSRTQFEIPFTWEKLRGVPDEYKKQFPALRISFAVRDNFSANIVPPAMPDTLELDAEEKCRIPVKFTDTGYVQIGEECAEMSAFELKITVHVASNLVLLLPKNLVFSSSPKKYYFSFNLFGITVQTRSFYRALHETIKLNETVVICLSSTVEILRLFFTQYSTVPMMFYNESDQLGWAEVNVGHLLNSNFEDRVELEEDCLIRQQEGGLVPTDKSNNKPVIKIRTSLEKVDLERELGQGEHCEKVIPTELDEYCSSIEEFDSGNTLCERIMIDKSMNKRSSSMIDVMPKIEESSDECAFEDNLSKSVPVLTETTRICKVPYSSYKKYCLAVIIDSIIWLKPTTISQYYFQFKHPQSSSHLDIKVTIDSKMGRRHLLDSVQCQLLYISTKEHIADMLKDYSPTIVLNDLSETALTESICLKTENIKDGNTSHQTYSTKVRAKNRQEVLADLTLILSLEELDMKPFCGSSHELRPQILDDFLVVKQLEELEKWKDEEKLKFDNDMKVKIQEELSELRKNWTDRKVRLEEELKKNIDRCKKISKDLKKSANILEIDKVLKKNEHKSEDSLNERIQRNYIKYSICENYELIENLTMQEHNIAVLKDSLNEAQLRVKELETSALTSEQTRNLIQELRALEEKYETAQKAKEYFKEQWKKSAIEVHTLKLEDNKNIKSKIQTGLDELSLMTMKTYVYDGKNDKNIEWSKTLLKSNLFDEKVHFIEKSNFDDYDPKCEK